MPPAPMPPGPARHRRRTERRSLDLTQVVDTAGRVGSLVTITAVLVLGGAAGVLSAGAPAEIPTVQATNAR